MKKILKKEKYVTEPLFEKHMGSIARTLSKIESRLGKIDEKLENHDKAFTLLLNQMKTIQEEGKEHRLSMLSLTHSDIRHERTIDDILIRVERLEKKIK